MKRYLSFLLAVLLVLGLCGCGKKNTETAESGTGPESETAVQNAPILKVELSLANLLDYFEYKEYKGAIRSEDGEKITSVQISYGFQLRDGYYAANVPEYKDTMELTFTAQGVVNKGSYDVDFSTLYYSGTTQSTETAEVTATLEFWPQGNRTITYQYGNYSDTYILYLQNFTVTSVKGTVYLTTVPPNENNYQE